MVLITGASSGIGESLALVAAAEGANLVLAARREDRLAQVATKARALGARVETVTCDVTSTPQVEAAILAAARAFGHLDICIANAGFGVTAPFDSLTNQDYRRQFDTNIFGVLRTARAALPMLERRAGVLALVGSVSSYISTPGDSPYSMSKAAVRALADSLFLELKPKGVHVALICPGFVESEIRQKNKHGEHRPEAKDPIPEWLVMSREKAAREIWNGLIAKKREIIITGHGKVLIWLRRFFPSLLVGLLVKLTPKLAVRNREA